MKPDADRWRRCNVTRSHRTLRLALATSRQRHREQHRRQPHVHKPANSTPQPAVDLSPLLHSGTFAPALIRNTGTTWLGTQHTVGQTTPPHSGNSWSATSFRSPSHRYPRPPSVSSPSYGRVPDPPGLRSGAYSGVGAGFKPDSCGRDQPITAPRHSVTREPGPPLFTLSEARGGICPSLPWTRSGGLDPGFGRLRPRRVRVFGTPNRQSRQKRQPHTAHQDRLQLCQAYSEPAEAPASEFSISHVEPQLALAQPVGRGPVNSDAISC